MNPREITFWQRLFYWPKVCSKIEQELKNKDMELIKCQAEHNATINHLAQREEHFEKQRQGTQTLLHVIAERNGLRLQILFLFLSISLCCGAGFPPPFTHQTWTTNLIPLAPLQGNYNNGNQAFFFNGVAGGAQTVQLGIRDGPQVFDYHLPGPNFTDALFLNRDGNGVFANDNTSARIFDQSNNVVVSVFEVPNSTTELELVQGSLQVTGPITNGNLTANQFVSTDANDQLVSTLNGYSLTNLNQLWTNDAGNVHLTTNLAYGSTLYLGGGTANTSNKVNYVATGDMLGTAVTFTLKYAGTNFIPECLAVTIAPTIPAHYNETHSFAIIANNTLTNTDSFNWTEGGDASYAFFSQTTASQISSGADIGICGRANGRAQVQAGVVGVSSSTGTVVTNVGVVGSTVINSSQCNVGVYGEVWASTAPPDGSPADLESAIFLGDSRNSQIRPLVLRAPSGRLQTDTNLNLSMTGIMTATNGVASYATNIQSSIPNTGFTNDVAHGWGTNNMIVDIIAVGETVAFYNRSGTSGQTSCGTLLFTDTGIANKEYNVGVNCGVAFSVGTFTSGTARAF